MRAFRYVGEPVHYAPTQKIIDDVLAAEKVGSISRSESTILVRQLSEGAICAPIWEDFGLKTRLDGRGMS